MIREGSRWLPRCWAEEGKPRNVRQARVGGRKEGRCRGSEAVVPAAEVMRERNGKG